MRHRFAAQRRSRCCRGPRLLAPLLVQQESSGDVAPAAVARQVTLRIGLFARSDSRTRPLRAVPKLHRTSDRRGTTSSCPRTTTSRCRPTRPTAARTLQGIEIGFVAESSPTTADQFVDLTVPNAAQIKSTFYAEVGYARPRTARPRPGTDAGPEAICYRPSLLKKAGLPTDRRPLAKQWRPGATSSRSARSTRRQQQEAQPLHRQRQQHLQRGCIPGSDAYDDASGSRSRRRRRRQVGVEPRKPGPQAKLTAGWTVHDPGGTGLRDTAWTISAR